MNIQQGKPPVHPGRILLEGYMKERGITINEMCQALDISRNQLSGIINGRKPVTTKTAVKLAEVTGTTARLWLNLQNKYDIWRQEKSMPRSLKKRLNRYFKAFQERVSVVS